MSPADHIPVFSTGIPVFITGVFDPIDGKYVPTHPKEDINVDADGIPVFGRPEERPVPTEDVWDCVAYLQQQQGGRWCMTWYLRPPHPAYLEWASITAETKVAALIQAKDKGLLYWVEGQLGTNKPAYPLP